MPFISIHLYAMTNIQCRQLHCFFVVACTAMQRSEIFVEKLKRVFPFHKKYFKYKHDEHTLCFFFRCCRIALLESFVNNINFQRAQKSTCQPCVIRRDCMHLLITILIYVCGECLCGSFWRNKAQNEKKSYRKVWNIELRSFCFSVLKMSMKNLLYYYMIYHWTVLLKWSMHHLFVTHRQIGFRFRSSLSRSLSQMKNLPKWCMKYEIQFFEQPRNVNGMTWCRCTLHMISNYLLATYCIKKGSIFRQFQWIYFLSPLLTMDLFTKWPLIDKLNKKIVFIVGKKHKNHFFSLFRKELEQIVTMHAYTLCDSFELDIVFGNMMWIL